MDENKFEYSFSAPTANERKEIEDIRKQYSEKQEKNKKLERLKLLDKKVKNLPVALSISAGIVGTLIFGTGLAMILEWNKLIWGAIVCAVGIVPIILAYFLYKKTYTKLKDKYGKEILKLSDELLNNK